MPAILMSDISSSLPLWQQSICEPIELQTIGARRADSEEGVRRQVHQNVCRKRRTFYVPGTDRIAEVIEVNARSHSVEYRVDDL